MDESAVDFIAYYLWESGTEYAYAITLQRTGVTFEGTINAWVTENGSGTAE
jgi:hypothetical protein